MGINSRRRLVVTAVFSLLLTFAATVCTAADLNAALDAFRAQQYEKAAAILRDLVEKSPQELGNRFWLGRAYFELGNFAAAETELLYVVNHKPESVQSWLWLGRVYEAMSQPKQARDAYEKVVELDSDNSQAREALLTLYEPPEPVREELKPRFIGLKFEGLDVPLDNVRIRSDHLYDYTFTEAASDWITETGHWAIVSRWACTPDWTWFGGMSDLVAVTWNKREFAGDLAVDAYMSFWHGIGPFNGYKTPSNLNITICGDGRNLDSGYSFIIGGWHNEWTRILRKGKIVAEANSDDALLPSLADGFPGTYELHRKWWNVKIRKHGGHLELFLDKKLVLEYDDPDPLEQGHIALWTFDNGIIIPRVKIYYEHEVTGREPVAYVTEPVRPDKETPILRLSSPTHPAVFNDFESDFGEWSNRDEEQGAVLSLSDDTPDGSKHSLKLINRNAGGTFGATVLKTAFDAAKLPRLSFDYRVPEQARVNFFVQSGGNLWELLFTAPDAPSPAARPLGRIAGVVADNRWHHAEVNLLGLLQQKQPEARSFPVSGIFVGLLSNDDYLQAGFGGNPALCSWYVDNFMLSGAGGSDATIKWVDANGVPATAYSFNVTDNPLTVADETPEGSENTATLTGLAPGVHYFHVRARTADGRWGPTAHYRIFVDNSGPVVTDLTPAPGSKDSGELIAARVLDDGAGVDLESLGMTVNQKTYALGSPGLSFDAERNLLKFDPAAAGQVFSDGQKVLVSIDSVADRLGNVTSPGPQWSFEVNRALDKTPPPPPKLLIESGDDIVASSLCDGTFENGLDEWANYGGGQGALVSQDARTAASGKYSLRLTNCNFGGNFGAYVRKSPFDAGKYRLVSFDYRMDKQIRADFEVYVNGQWRTIAFADINNTQFGPPIGSVGKPVRDGKWHHAEFDLYRLLVQENPKAPGYRVEHFILQDGTSNGWRGNARGAYYNIDNFTIVPVVSSQGGLKLTLDCNDVSGIDAFNCIVDTSPNTAVPMKPRFAGKQAAIAPVPSGQVYVHVRARDGAGNWSETTHQRLFLDADSPTVSQYRPADGVRAAPSEIVIPLRDTGVAGVDPGSIVLVVAGKPYRVENNGLTYDARSGVLTWNCEKVAPKPVIFQDGQTVTVELKSANDYAGNAVAPKPRWSWIMDYSQDRVPPVIARLQSDTHPGLPVDTFETTVGEWRPYGDSPGIVERDETTAASGRASLRVRNSRAGGAMSCYVRQTPFDAAKYPIVAFDYKIGPGVHVDFTALCNGTWANIRFTDNDGDVHGIVPNVRTDNQWHHAEFNLLEILRRAIRRPSGFRVTALLMTDRRKLTNPADAVFNIDNFVIARPGGPNVALAWHATDTTGIVDYSYALNDDAAYVPDQQGEGLRTRATFNGITPGLHFFHLRAKDGAGNWGIPIHYPIYVR